MTITVSPYLITPLGGRSPQPADGGTAAPRDSAPSQAANDSVTLSPAAQDAMKSAPEPQKTPLQSTLETILNSVQTSTGPTLTFRPAPDSQTGKTLDQTC
jgi:hypothetical protein